MARLIPPNAELLLQCGRFSVVRQQRTTPAGETVVRETVQHPGSVVVIPLLDGGRVCLLRNDRLAVGATLIELPAGTLDRDEPPVETARRELAEETGYTAGTIEPLAEMLMSPGILHERTHVFVATGLSPGPTSLEPGEEIERFEVPWDEALRLVDLGRIEDAKTIAALLLYDRRRRG
jgi:ADP-ribose pyrophosphatase